MTKEEIQRVLDLSLEYYKSEVFGTDKESEKPSRERIDWIYDKMTGSSEIPKDLEKAARKSAIAPFNLDIDEEHLYEYPYLPIAEQKFIEGAKWQKEQIMKDAMEGWVAADSDAYGKRRVTFFPKKPVRDVLTEYKYWAATRPEYESIKLDSNVFPELKWEDEPKKVHIIIVKED